ncbi:Tripartite-type tricarboxylate transporter, receptor component TctC [Lentibacillus halodurans]|uniref:Tripartite-type tricarboxylate transporter, receptor component TctC n=1 Tax=Lentibacillus halodurans TaxID=237679 RepID=A0A1I1AJ46_9BACI|nr:tripartite tricarboxylate transporter substrate binding protein [Lentibacillus halodurans]SFB36363.1 Tripartite-type tricarboxylate transporter, receptor component TctC [Lentibacillus halodurans]
MLDVMFGKKRFVTITLLALLLLLVACSNHTSGTESEGEGNNDSAEAENAESGYPNNDINVLIGFDPGGGSDQLAQLTQPYLQEYLDANFVNEYNPGASGAIAWTRLAQQAENDGYTISVTPSPQVVSNYILNPELDYRLDELEPIANVVTDPGVIVVPNDSQFDTYEDFANYVEENPGDLTVSHSGVGGDDFFTTLRWMNTTGLEVEMAPYDGDGPSWQAAAGGDVAASFNNLGVVFSQVNEGNLKALAVMSEERMDLLPDVPTLKELGVDLVTGSSRGYTAPKGIPEDAKQELYEAFEQLSEDDEFKKSLEEVSLPVDIKIGEEYINYLNEQEETTSEIWDEVKDEYEG